MNLDFATRELENGIVDDDFKEPVWIVSMHKVDLVRILWHR